MIDRAGQLGVEDLLLVGDHALESVVPGISRVVAPVAMIRSS